MYTNTFSPLLDTTSNDTMDDAAEQPTNPVTPCVKPTQENPNKLRNNDTNVTHLPEVIINQLNFNRQNQAAAGELLTCDPQPQYEDPAFQTIPTVNPIQHIIST
jgi:hypothetical protein